MLGPHVCPMDDPVWSKAAVPMAHLSSSSATAKKYGDRSVPVTWASGNSCTHERAARKMCANVQSSGTQHIT